MSVNGTNFRIPQKGHIPQKGQAKKGNLLEEGGGEVKGEERIGRTRTNEDKGQQREEGGDQGRQQGMSTDEDKA